MREIKCRGLTNNNKWIFGELQRKEQSRWWIEPPFYQGDFVQSLTVGQYSGLDDRNGTPIYEGDILTGLTRWNMDYTVTCVFENGAFGAEWYHNDYRHFMPFACFYGVEWEVVGNKWEDEK